jgi:hypothetical protein
MSITRKDLSKPLACFTVVQDEDVNLRLWLAHYRLYAPTASLYILDHNSRGSYRDELYAVAAQYDARVLPVHNAYSFDYAWLVQVVERFWEFLLCSHSAVCFSEADELVWNPAGTLEDILKSPNPFFRAQGYGVVHTYPDEPDLDWHKPFLRQRTNWYRSPRYSKICLARRPVFFTYGMHQAKNVPDALEPEEDLLLLHLHQADFKTTLRRHQNNAGLFWQPQFRLHAHSLHQRLDNPSDLQKYLLCDLDRPTEYATLETIPDDYKTRYDACVQTA